MKEGKAGGNRSSVRRYLSGLFGSEGEFTPGCAVILILMAVGGFVAYKFIIPYYHYSSFEGRVSEMMPYYRGQDAVFVKGAVQDVASEFGIELDPKRMRVQVLKMENRLIIDFEYDEVVELPFYSHTLTFSPHLTGSVY